LMNGLKAEKKYWTKMEEMFLIMIFLFRAG